MQEFSGLPITKWQDDGRIMTLEDDFHYIDSNDKKWNAPAGGGINGATIPRPLWAIIGSPYTGNYRRASIVHDVAVGENGNPVATKAQRKEADRMFYDACIYDGCSRKLAGLLYIGVSMGTWASQWLSTVDTFSYEDELEETRYYPEDKFIRMKFWQIIDDARTAIENGDLDAMDQTIKKYLTP